MKKVTRNEVRKLIATNKEFESFLKEKRILCKYVNNTVQEANHGIWYSYKQTEESIQEKLSPNEIFWNSFAFQRTKEGKDYWEKLVPDPGLDDNKDRFY